MYAALLFPVLTGLRGAFKTFRPLERATFGALDWTMLTALRPRCQVAADELVCPLPGCGAEITVVLSLGRPRMCDGPPKAATSTAGLGALGLLQLHQKVDIPRLSILLMFGSRFCLRSGFCLTAT